MKKTYAFLATLLLASGVAAQTPTAYFMEGTTFRSQFNPAFAPLRGYVNIPGLGGIDINASGNLAVDKLLYPRNGKLVTLLDEAVSTRQALSGLKADNLLGIDTDDEMANRMVNFVEIAADTVVGELKNNFVQVGKENGVTQYQIEIAQNQVPSLVNAGLSLFAYSVDASNRENYTVNFADYSATVIHNYESTTGETLPEEFKDGYSNGYDDAWYETYGDLLDKVEEVNATNWEDKYYNVLEEQGGGIVYVSEDGSYDYYADYDAFAAAHPEAVGDSLESYVGQDLNLEKVLCTFSVDDQGRLTDNHIEVTFQTTEKDGSSHTLVLTGDVTLTNYGTTTIQPLDVGDRTLITY